MVRQVITFDGFLKEVENKMNAWMRENEKRYEYLETDLVAVNANFFVGMITYIERAGPAKPATKRPKLETK